MIGRWRVVERPQRQIGPDSPAPEGASLNGALKGLAVSNGEKPFRASCREAALAAGRRRAPSDPQAAQSAAVRLADQRRQLQALVRRRKRECQVRLMRRDRLRPGQVALRQRAV